MRNKRQIKILSMVALVIAIVGMSLGFAAFSTTLSISSSASVTPSSDGFKLHLHNKTTHTSNIQEQAYNIVGYNGATVDSPIKYHPNGNLSIPFMQGGFSEPGQYVELIVYIVNEGVYDAYLNDVVFHNYDGTESFASCSVPESSDATKALVDAACDDFSVTIDIDGNLITNNSPNLNNYVLEKGDAALLIIRMIYNEGGDRADGNFNVNFGKIEFHFSTFSNAGKKRIISFTIDGASYQAEEGMTWNDWVSSIYNTSGLVVSESGRICVTYSEDYFSNCVFSNDERTYGYIYDGTVVAEGENYVMLSGSYSN